MSNDGVFKSDTRILILLADAFIIGSQAKVVHSSPKETQLFISCLSFEEECTPFDFSPNIICRMLLVAISQSGSFASYSQQDRLKKLT